jgi:spore coat polysaccharide biosynthesis protein SpsF
MDIVAIIQARMGSTRLSGKVLSEILGKPMLQLQVERLRRARHIARIVLATTNVSADDAVAALGERIGLLVFRGSENDVLDRYYRAALLAKAMYIMRLTADCPLIDPDVCDLVAEEYERTGCDYLCTGESFAEGLDCEVISFKALEASWQEAHLQSEREHVTLFVRNHPERFNIRVLENKMDDSHIRITVDEPEDLEVVRAIFNHFREDPSGFGIAEIRAFILAHPELARLNAAIMRNAGLFKSLAEDQKHSEPDGDPNS